jgi:integrase
MPAHKLSATQLRKPRPGRYFDGAGLWLYVSPGGAQNWVYRYTYQGRRREMGLKASTLADARSEAADHRRLLRQEKVDPLAHRQAEDARKRLDEARAITFQKCAEAYVEAHRAGWRNAKHADQWSNTLRTYACPVFGDWPVGDVDTEAVLQVLKPIWESKTETASRLRGRIENVLDWARVRGYREGENPARWRGHLDKLLPKRSRVAPVTHHAALPYAQLPAVMAEIRAREGNAARALEFTTLTAARSGEVLGATWEEIDLEHKVWTVPASRMKARKQHRVPLSEAAAAVLRGMEKLRSSNHVFPGHRYHRPLSNVAMAKVLQRVGYGEYTVHGMRSTFRDWCAEHTAYPREVAEAALAHVLSNKAEAAYQRGDLFEKRRKLMQSWADYSASQEVREILSLTRGQTA